MSLLYQAAQCGDGDVRLAGSFLLEGPPEMCVTGEWKRICGEGWDNQDATVVCRELGFSDEG